MSPSEGPRGRALPPRIEAVITEVVAASGIDWAGGREELERELRAHFEDGLAEGRSVEDLVARFGDPRATGRRIAGSGAGARSGHRGRGLRAGLAMLVAEARLAARRLLHAPVFTSIVVLTLALGVGANTAVFTVLDAVLLDELPYSEPDRLVRIYEGRFDDPAFTGFLRVPTFREYRSWDVFESVGAIYTYREVGADLTDLDQPVRVTVLRVSSGYFETLGVVPSLGRTFWEEESFGPGTSQGSTDVIARVAVVSDRFWRDLLDSDPRVVGRVIRLDGASYEVIGVLPAGFVSPFGPKGDVWVPQDMRMGGSNSFNNWYLSAVGRLRDGVDLDAARGRTEVLATAYNESQPDAYGQVPRLVPLQDDVVGATRARMLWILAAASLLVLLTACLNVTNLLLARGLEGRRHLALRSALGAGRSRLVAGLLLESALLAAAGGVAGIVVARIALTGLLAVAPDALPLVTDPELGVRAFVFASVVTCAALLALGLAPAASLTRSTPADALRAGDRGGTAGRAAGSFRRGLVIAQVALALVLVTGAVALTRSFRAIVDVPLGIEPDGVLTFEVNLPESRYPDGASRHALHEQLQARVRDLAGVEAVGAVSWLPVSGRYHEWGFSWDGATADGSPDARWNPTDVRVIAGDYFDGMGIDVLRGAPPADVDMNGEAVVWINRRVESEVFGSVDPLGRAVWMNGAIRRIVGVVEDVPYGVRGESSRKAYMPHAQFSDDRNWALIQVVRARGDLRGLEAEIRREVATVDPSLVLHRPRPFSDVLDAARAQDRFATALMGVFAALAFALALLGTYGVVSGSVTRRAREIGIRIALGADAPRVRGLVLRYAAGVTVPGIVIGLGVAWAASRWIDALLFDVRPRDPVTFATAATIFVAVGALAAWAPAARATRTDPVRTLSAE